MTTTNHTSVALGDATSWAENIVHTAINMRAADRLSGAALRLWQAGAPLFEAETGSPDHRQAVKLSLDALIMQPEVLAWVARESRDHLANVEAAETTPAPAITKARPDLKLQNVVNSIDDLLAGVLNGGLYGHLPPTADAMFSAGMHLSEGGRDEYPYSRRAGYLMALTALLQAPEVLPVVVQNLRSALLAADPQLAPLAGDVTPLEHVPLAVNHQIDGLGLELRPDGELTIEHHPHPLVSLTPREAYALLMFFRSPAVVALLEAQHAARMTASELGFQKDQAEEAARMAAR